jgi:hydroxymethylbilane synthase
MAVGQAEHVADLLSTLVPGLDVTISGITTTADQWAGDLAALGGKGAFTKEIDRALLMGEIAPSFLLGIRALLLHLA